MEVRPGGTGRVGGRCHDVHHGGARLRGDGLGAPPDEPGSWHFLTLPGDVSDDIAAEAGPPTGFGSVRVVVTIGDTTWRTSLFPDTKAGSYLLPLKKQVRAVERLQAGDTCRVRLSLE
jgi:hypothetical protein